MGLLTGLLTLPLAPVRGTVWVAKVLAEEAARELDEEKRVRTDLERLTLDHELGRIDADEFERREDELLDRLDAVRAATTHDENGGDGGGYEQ